MGHSRTRSVWQAVFLLSLSASCALGVKVDISSDPSGIVFKVPDEGFSLVGLHYSINKPVADVAAGDVNVDIPSATGDNFIYEDKNHQLHPGDKVNYWLLTVSKTTGEGHVLKGQTFVYTGPTTTTTTTASTTATSTAATATNGPTLREVIAQQVTGSTQQTGSGSDSSNITPSTSNSGSDETSGRSDSGTSQTGNCGCSGGSAPADPYNKEWSCTSYPCLIFEDEFDALDCQLWEHEITAGGGGNWEFQYYTNNRSNSYVRDGKLFIKPTLVTDRFGPQFPEGGHLNLWGSNPTDTCTGNNFYGCERTGMPGQVVNPVQSARLRSSRHFNFKYGRLEVEAKMPNGDWLWPAIWLLPRWNSYGIWPASGEIDIVESRGNANYRDNKGQSAGVDSMGSTLHFGPFVEANQWEKAHASITAKSGTFGDSFHKYRLDWDDKSIRFSVDGQEILAVDPGSGGFWDFGEFEKDGQSKWDNPWAAGGHMAPFDQKFYIIMNVAVGGVGFFPDDYVNSPYPKPWNDKGGHAATAFWNARNNWLPTWKLDQNNGEDAAMQVKYVRVWKMAPTP